MIGAVNGAVRPDDEAGTAAALDVPHPMRTACVSAGGCTETHRGMAKQGVLRNSMIDCSAVTWSRSQLHNWTRHRYSLNHRSVRAAVQALSENLDSCGCVRA